MLTCPFWRVRPPYINSLPRVQETWLISAWFVTVAVARVPVALQNWQVSRALCLRPVAGQACPVVADGPELLCGLHLAALPQKLSSEKYNEPSCPEARRVGVRIAYFTEYVRPGGPAKERRHSCRAPSCSKK